MFFFDNNNIQVFEPCSVEHAYLAILKEDLDSAEKVFASIDSPRAKWGTTLISILKSYLTRYPTYFEIRNFLEIDLNILITYCQGTFVEKIIRYADYMYTINPEVHKFIGRVLYNNGLKEQGLFFLNRAKSYFYHDPELHFLLSYIYFLDKDYVKAQKSVDDCLRILPDYFPARDMKKKLESYNA